MADYLATGRAIGTNEWLKGFGSTPEEARRQISGGMYPAEPSTITIYPLRQERKDIAAE